MIPALMPVAKRTAQNSNACNVDLKLIVCIRIILMLNQNYSGLPVYKNHKTQAKKLFLQK
jgi:hypothetical protein